MPIPLELELEKINRAEDLNDMKEVLRDHAIDDADRHKQIMEVLKPISDAFSSAGGFKKGVMILGSIIVFVLTTIWLSMQIYFRIK